MTRRDDDLSRFREDPVFQALAGPATDAELAGEAEAVAAFRSATSSSSRRRFAARIGTGGTVAIATLALSGGVAAAYTASFPAPVQRALHAALGPIDVPAPQKNLHKANDKSHPPHPISAASAPTVTAAPTPVTVGAPSPHASPTVPPGGATPTPVVTPTLPVLVTTPTPTPTPSSTRKPPLKGAALTITTSASRVVAGMTVTVMGQLDAADSTAVAGRRVVLAERLTGQSKWTRVGVAQVTASAGTVTFTTSALDHNALLVLRTGRHVHSDIAKVVVVPTITQTVVPSATNPGFVTVTVQVVGGQPGDVVSLNQVAAKKRHRQAVLDDSGTVTFTIQIPKQRAVTYRLFVRRTKAHAYAASPAFTVSPG